MANITMKNYNDAAEQWEELYPKTTADQIIDGDRKHILTNKEKSNLEQLITMLQNFELHEKNGFVLMDDSLRVPFEQIPIESIVPKLYKCSVMTDIQHINPKIGDYLLRTDTGNVYIYIVNDGDPSDLNSWQSISSSVSSSGAVTSVNGYRGDVTLNKSMVGLSNVENIPKEDYFISPTFTGVAKAPTPQKESNDDTVATTSYVKTVVSDINSSNLNLFYSYDEPEEASNKDIWIDLNPIGSNETDDGESDNSSDGADTGDTAASEGTETNETT